MTRDLVVPLSFVAAARSAEMRLDGAGTEPGADPRSSSGRGPRPPPRADACLHTKIRNLNLEKRSSKCLVDVEEDTCGS